MNKCTICERNNQIKKGKNPYFVKEFKTGFVVLSDYQFYKGYTLFLAKKHVREIHQLPEGVKIEFLKEMSLVVEAVFKAFKPLKLNYEALGNTDPHLHWHIIPRYKNDPNPKQPIWIIDSAVRYAKIYKPNKKDLSLLKKKLLVEINKLWIR